MDIDVLPADRVADVRKCLLDTSKNLADDYVSLAEMLKEVSENKYHRKWGYGSFHDYLDQELDIRPRKGDFLVAIARTVENLALSWEEISGIGWRKLGAVYPIMDSDNYEELLEIAQNKSLPEVTEEVKARKEGKTTSEEVKKNLSFKLTEEEHSIVEAALEKAMEVKNKKNEAITHICYEWFMGGK